MINTVPMKLDDLVRALSSKPGIPGLTPTSRSKQKGKTANVVEQMLRSLQQQETQANS